MKAKKKKHYKKIYGGKSWKTFFKLAWNEENFYKVKNNIKKHEFKLQKKNLTKTNFKIFK